MGVPVHTEEHHLQHNHPQKMQKCSHLNYFREMLTNTRKHTEENKDGLAVAHLSGGNIEKMLPLQVTETN